MMHTWRPSLFVCLQSSIASCAVTPAFLFLPGLFNISCCTQQHHVHAHRPDVETQAAFTKNAQLLILHP